MQSLAINGFTLTHAAINATGISSTEKLILATLSSFANFIGTCFPSNQTLAIKTGLHERTVRRQIENLQEKGLIQRVSRGQGRSMLTRILLTPQGKTPDIVPPTPDIAPPYEPIRNLIPITAAPASPPTAGAATVVSEKIPEQPEPLAITVTEEPLTPQEPGKVCAINCTEAAQDHRDQQPADTIKEALKTPVEAPNESDHTDPLASVPQAILDDWAEVRKAKKKAPKANRSEVKVLQAEARLAGLSMEQLILGMVLRGWTHYSASWGSIKPVPIEATPVVSKLWEPEPHTPASPSTISRMKEKIAEMKQRWRSESVNAPPMSQ